MNNLTHDNTKALIMNFSENQINMQSYKSQGFPGTSELQNNIKA